MDAEYIKREDAINAIGEIYPLDYIKRGIKERIENIPTMYIVRCKDCKYAQFTEPEYIFCENNWTNPPLDGFCSYGERKDDAVD